MDNRFEFSNESIKKYKNKIYTAMLLLPTMIIMINYLMLSMNKFKDSKISWSISLAIAVISLIELYRISRKTIKRMKKTKIYIYEDGFTKTGGEMNKCVIYSDITHMKVKRDCNDEILRVELKVHNMPIILYGFHNMESIVNSLIDRTNDDIILKEKKYKMDCKNPFLSVFIMFSIAI